ncbi:MAG: relaxase/mobilization nuclease domain-containing protein [Alphaproteobacteria bacterium]
MAVLIKGKSIKCTQTSRDHYLRGSENERITVREVKGFATKDPDEALRMIASSAKGTKCEKPVYSAKINPETDRIWNKDEINAAVELLEENLGLKGHPRVVVEHKKNGRIHFHVLWSRFNPDSGTAVRMSNDYAAHQKTQRQLEKGFKLRPMMTKGRDFKQSEVEWAKRYGFDIFKLREQITADFNKSKSGQEFMAALKDQGIVLCRGDKSQFVIILPWGQHKALSSMIHGRPTKAVLRRSFTDIDISKLPTVAEGKAQVKATLPKTSHKSRGGTYIKSAPQTAAYRAAGRLIAPRQTKPLSTPTMAAALTTENASPAPQRATSQQGQSAGEQNFTSNPESIGGGEVSSGRAEAAYKEEFDKWSGMIDDIASNPSLSKEQRAAAIAGLRQRQQAAANGVRKRVSDEEKAITRVARRARRILPGRPEPMPPKG